MIAKNKKSQNILYSVLLNWKFLSLDNYLILIIILYRYYKNCQFHGDVIVKAIIIDEIINTNSSIFSVQTSKYD